jgi:hypothetical protein
VQAEDIVIIAFANTHRRPGTGAIGCLQCRKGIRLGEEPEAGYIHVELNNGCAFEFPVLCRTAAGWLSSGALLNGSSMKYMWGEACTYYTYKFIKNLFCNSDSLGELSCKTE